jgi:osmotically-inducible protein OsmY
MTYNQQQEDETIRDTLIEELEWMPNVNSTHVGVSVEHGAVTLSGEVDSYPEKIAVEKAALRMRGVKAVAEEITVKGIWAKANDSDIARMASDALDHAIDVPVGSVKAVVNDRFITLSGAVAWHFQKVAAEREVAYLKGVTGVFNSITIKPVASAAGVKASITAALVRTARDEGNTITVTATEGSVVLEGTVHSAAERRQAGSVAWSAPGVSAVENLIVVK